MSPIVKFYTGDGLDQHGRIFNEILQKDNEWWEDCHDHIQWVFPLKEPSRFNPDAPLLTDEDINILSKDKIAQLRIKAAYNKFMLFLGFNKSFTYLPGGRWELVNDGHPWLSACDHNHLRISRAIRCFRFFGQTTLSLEMYEDCIAAAINYGSPMMELKTLKYWQQALISP